MSIYKNKFKDIKVKKEDHLLWINLDRPDYSNAISENIITTLCTVLKYADFDRDIRVILLTGSGKCFCAGGDVKAMENKSGMFAGEPNELRLSYMKGIQQIPLTIESLSTPLIALVNGPAIGAGLDLACMCDIRIASNKAKFGETFTKLGLIPGDGGTFFLERIIGFAKTMELSLTGEIIDSYEALKINLITKVVEPDDLLYEGKKLAIRIAQNAPISISMIKKALKNARNNELSNHLDLMAAYQAIAQRTNDHVEGIRALKNKNLAKFQGI